MDITGKRILITGGSGLIGTRIAQTLLDRGAAGVTLYDNLSLSTLTHLDSLLLEERVTFVQGDILDPAQMVAACEGIDGIFAIAAFLVIPLAKNPRLGLRVNVEGMVNTLDAARQCGVEKVVLASSISVYGDSITGVVTEATPFGSTSLSPAFAIYALSKLIGEQLGCLYASGEGPEFSAVRFATVYGERQHDRGLNALQMIKAYESIKAGRAPVIMGSGEDGHDFIYVGDAAEGAVRAMEAGRSGASYTIGTGQSHTTKDAVETVVKLTGTDLMPNYVEDTRGSSAPTLHETLRLDVSAARDDLGWTAQVSLEDGIGRLLAWLSEKEQQ